MGTANYKWSYSSLSLFKQCPYKYYRLRVKRDLKEPESEQIRYGLDLHKAAEEFVRDKVSLPERFAFIREPLELLASMDGTHLCEHKLGLRKDLSPCAFEDKGVWWRGIADLLIVQDDRAFVVDYKSGKSAKYADSKQLEIMALAVFKHFPQVKHVKAGLLFVVANDFIRTEYKAENAHVHWMPWLEDTARLEKAIELDVWNPKPNFTCKKWCIVHDCIHNGKGEY